MTRNLVSRLAGFTHKPCNTGMNRFGRVHALTWLLSDLTPSLSSYFCLFATKKVSELLGSFGDNELSPECLDGAQRFLREDGISIPAAYTSYLAPMTCSKLYKVGCLDVLSCKMSMVFFCGNT